MLVPVVAFNARARFGYYLMKMRALLRFFVDFVQAFEVWIIPKDIGAFMAQTTLKSVALFQFNFILVRRQNEGRIAVATP